MKYILITIFFLLNFLIYYESETDMNEGTESSLNKHLHNLQIHYEVFLTTQSHIADTMFESIVNVKSVKSILTKVHETEDLEKIHELRVELQNLLFKDYGAMKEQGILQLQFVLPNNNSFLRMHKPSKFGDDLSWVRLDIARVNTEHTLLRGFSQGRTAHAFRNVYPLFDEKGNYLCAVEISYPSELLQKNLNEISEIYSHFLVKKNIFEAKAWKRDDLVLNYVPSHVNDNYLLTKNHINDRCVKKLHIDERLKILEKEIDEKLNMERMFSLVSAFQNKTMIISFIPIYQNFTGEVSAWVVSYEMDQVLTDIYKKVWIARIVGFLIVSLLIFFIFSITKQRKRLKKMVSLYDKNVIFSTTDTKGIITHVSDAFCKISGYSKEELIGKPHNIVRHRDMPSKVFKDLWETIKQHKTWTGEVKNLRKDGSDYWVEAEVEEIVENNKIVGYSSIRQDITDRKELDMIQKDIIFTMGTIGENRSKETGNHVKRVALYSQLFARYYGLSESEIETIYQASPMHDIGKIAIPDAILNKPGKLTNDEMLIMKTHAQKGYEMLSISSRPLLQAAAIVAYHHHEKWDGSGYPRGLMKKEIDIFGRITAIADVFDALGSDRVYKDAWEDEKIFAFLKEESGKHFEPRLVEIFFEHLDEFLAIRDSLK